jgi:hypothetical protein
MGEPIRIEIRKVFDGYDKINKAIEWEQKVLRRIKAAYRVDYLNKRDLKGINYSDPQVAMKRKHTNSNPQTKERRRAAAIKREADPIKKKNRIDKAFSREAILKRKQSFAKTVNSPDFKEKRRQLSYEINRRPDVIKANREKNSGLNNARALQDRFTFKNKVTGEVKILTCYEMTQYIRTQGIKYAHASSLLKNRIKTLGGWELILNYN